MVIFNSMKFRKLNQEIYEEKTGVNIKSETFKSSFLLFNTMLYRDYQTANHCVLVAGTNIDLALALDLDIHYEQLFLGGLVHDIGKLTMPDTVLKGADKLRGRDKASIYAHVYAGTDLLVTQGFPDLVN